MKVLKKEDNLNYSIFFEKIADIQKDYIRDGFAFISSTKVLELLTYLGVNDNELDVLKIVSNDLPPDPTLRFRESRNGRFFHNNTQGFIYRTEFQPFVLSSAEDFIRHDSGQLRKFTGLSENLTKNTAFQGLLRIKNLIINNTSIQPRPNLNYKTSDWVTTVFNLRTLTSRELLGEPALEGVHSDGVDHTMTTILGYKNMTDDSAITHIHSNEEKSGIRFSQTKKEYLLASMRHKDFLDTVLIKDNERKHSLSPVYQKNEDKLANRDMLIFFTRKQCVEGHVSFNYDSNEPHPDYPVKFDVR
ncbi:hypothetical protein FQ082_12765 [Psychrobacter sp. ANT_H56B]|uniref:2OG-Fe dioxygenase family protein n=1 Tax=unclassified Psychrobacter TaxID=196806 RepID=UPI0011F26552|nr:MULTISPECIES: 2OG-Fe dioxygenase family protein [unclassified Psychrobacter]KAA0921710.1 hypothetical protein FQ082_12765 [Psychrobacter sp. ANT_H56B]QJS05912.1 dioxygenase Fe-dependent [Psychrobacter sp.]